MYFNKFCYFINVLGDKFKHDEKALNRGVFLESLNQSLTKNKLFYNPIERENFYNCRSLPLSPIVIGFSLSETYFL